MLNEKSPAVIDVILSSEEAGDEKADSCVKVEYDVSHTHTINKQHS